MDDLLEDISAEKERINTTLIEFAAIATCLHKSYKNLLKRIFKYLKVSLPSSEASHKDLLVFGRRAENHLSNSCQRTQGIPGFSPFLCTWLRNPAARGSSEAVSVKPSGNLESV